MAATTNLRRPTIGDECWFVLWCSKTGLVDEDRPELGEMRERRVGTREEAVALAREVYRVEQNGAVSYWPARFVPMSADDAGAETQGGRWEETDEEEYYDGDGGPSEVDARPA